MIKFFLIIFLGFAYSGPLKNKIIENLNKKLSTINVVYKSETIEKTKDFLKKNTDRDYLYITYNGSTFEGEIINQSGDISPISKGRAALLIDFLNQHLKKRLKDQKSFSFFMPLGDDSSIPETLMEHLKDCPVLMTDMSKAFYQAHEEFFLFPDFYLLSSDFSKKIKKIEANKCSFESKKDIAFWRGSQTGGSYDMETKDQFIRYRLVDFSLKNPTYVDAKFVNHTCQVANSESGKTYTKFMDDRFKDDTRPSFVKLKDQVLYKYIVCVDGNVGAWESPIHIMASHSIPLYNTEFIQFFTPYLEENTHFISIQSDLSDLKEKIDYLRTNPNVVDHLLKSGEEAYKDLNYETFIEYATLIIQFIQEHTK